MSSDGCWQIVRRLDPIEIHSRTFEELETAVARMCDAGVAQEPPRSTYWLHMNLPLYSPTAPAAGR